MTASQWVGAVVLAVLVLGYLGWVAWEEPVALVALFFSLVFGCVVTAAILLASGVWAL